MRFLPSFILCSVMGLHSLHAQDLAPADKEAVLEQLEILKNVASNTIDSRFRLAVSAYREAATSDEKAFDLYIQCLEKVEYTDLHRKSQDFRDWKKKEENNLGKPGFRRALRYQLRWLSLTLEAASSKPDKVALNSKAKDCVSALFDDLKSMDDQEQVLTQAVTSTVFAKAYGVDKIVLSEWPRSPIALEDMYEIIFLPPLRNPAKLAELRAAWIKRIEQELAIRDSMARYARKLKAEQEKQDQAYQSKNSPNEKNSTYNEVKIGMADAMHPPEYEEFRIKVMPELIWKMEVDLFINGDQMEGSKRMLAHIQKYIDHPSAKQWALEFKGLLSPEIKLQPMTPSVAEAPVGAGS